MINQLELHAKSKPTHIALKDDSESLSYAQLYDSVRSLSGFFLDNISTPTGIVVVNVIPLVPKWVIILALRFAGFTTIAISDLPLLEELKIEGIIAFVSEKHNREAHEYINHNFPKTQLISAPSSDFKYNSKSLSEQIDILIGGHIEFTSGSTGNYKAIHREGVFLQDLINRAISEFHINSDTKFYLGAFHPGTAVGSKVPLACLYLGASCIFNQTKNYIWGLVGSGADRTFMTPLMVRTLSKLLENNNFPTTPLRLYCGGGFLDSELAFEVKNKLNCSIYLNYAASECGVVLQSDVHQAEDTTWLRPLTNKIYEVVDDEGELIKDDSEGILKVKLEPCDPKNYMNDKDTSGENFQHGFFITRDIVSRRSDGKIRVIGREKNVINLGGDKKAVEPMEQQASKMLKVSNVCLFSSQNEAGRSILISVVEADKIPSEESLREFALKIGKYFSKVEVHLLDKFPCQMTGMIKLDRKAIKKSLSNQTLKSTLNIKFN